MIVGAKDPGLIHSDHRHGRPMSVLTRYGNIRGDVIWSPLEAHRSHETKLAGLTIHRALPVRGRRMVGPWCFLDRFGPMSFARGKPMDVGAHPHIGIQTVSWILDGEIVHHDTLGHEAPLRSGGVNIMTAGQGIAHAEDTPGRNRGRLSGVQLWVALEDAHRNRTASFQHLARVPALVRPGGIAQVFAGELDGTSCAVERFSDLVGADLQVHEGEGLSIPLRGDFEHAFFLLDGDCSFEGQDIEARTLYYLPEGRSEGEFRSREGARVLLVGGPPFREKILMWWNFVARTTAEIKSARADWVEHRRFGEVHGYAGDRIEAPEMMRLSEP